MGKKLLVVCNFFSPINSIGSVRMSKMVKYFVRMGWDITVIYEQRKAGFQYDNSLECPEFDNIRRIMVPYSGLIEKTLINKRNQYRGGGKKDLPKAFKVLHIKDVVLGKFIKVYNKILENDWKKQVIKTIKTTMPNETFDCAISTFKMVSPHMICRVLKKKGIIKRWVADYRDIGISKSHRHFLREADSITAVADILCNNIVDLCPECRDKVNLIWNGYDSDDIIKKENLEEATSEFSIVYAGSFYDGYDLSPLFRAFRSLIDNNKIDANDLRFNYVGGQSSFVFDAAKNFNLEEIVKDYGYVGRSEVLEIYDKSTIATMVSLGTTNGKMYEILMKQKELITIVCCDDKDNCHIIPQLSAINCGFIYSPFDEQASEKLEEYILQKYSEWKNNGYVKSHYSISELERYSYSNLAKEFEALMNK